MTVSQNSILRRRIFFFFLNGLLLADYMTDAGLVLLVQLL